MTTNCSNKTMFSWPTMSGGWHKPGNPVSDMMDAQAMRLQHLTEELQKVYSETYDRQIEALGQTGERLTQSMKALMSCQGTADVVNAESQLANTWLDEMANRSQHWLTLGQKLQQCYADFVRASFDDLRKQGEEIASEASEAAASAGQEVGKQLKAVKTGSKHAA